MSHKSSTGFTCRYMEGHKGKCNELKPPVRRFTQAELNDAVQAARDEERSIGPCGKHPKACYVDPEKIVSVGNGEITRGYCSICAASASPCGQKFSDGTPHPASLWREKSEYHAQPFYNGPDMKLDRSFCLICQSEEKLRHGLEVQIWDADVNWKTEHIIADNRNRELYTARAELATLREGLQGIIAKMDDSYAMLRDKLASLLAPPPTARDGKEINSQFKKAGKEFGNC